MRPAAALDTTDAVVVTVFVGVMCLLIGYAAHAKVRGRLWRELGRRGWLIAVVVLGAATVALLLGFGDEVFGDKTSTIGQVAAGLTLGAATLALWFAGGGQMVAESSFVAEEGTATTTTLPAKWVVPPDLAGDKWFSDKAVAGWLADSSFTYWSGGAKTAIEEGKEVPDAALEQKPDIEWHSAWETSEPVPIPEEPVRQFEVGDAVDAEIAALAVNKDKVVDGKRVTTEFERAGETITVGRILKGEETRWIEAEGHTDPVKVAVKPITHQPVKTVPAGTPVTPEERQLSWYRGKLREFRAADHETSYFKDAKKVVVTKGDVVPDDAGDAAKRHSVPATVLKDKVAFNGWVFRQGDVIPKAAHQFMKNRPTEWRRGGYLRALVVGTDNRWSTSKTQAILWTFVVAYILLSLLYFAAVLDGDLNGRGVVDDATSFSFSELELPDAYYVLLGGPFAAFILAKAFTASKVENGTLVKPDADSTAGPVDGISQIVNDDAGNTDLVDFQYFIFNLVALGFVLVTFILHPADGFPEVPAVLFGLTSASALAYTAKKGVERTVPQITNISPRRVRAGDVLDIWGRNLVVTADQPPEVQVGGRRAAGVRVVRGEREGVDHLQIAVGDLGDAATVTVVVVPSGARPTDTVELEVDALALEDVAPLPIRISADTRIVIKGRGFGDTASPVTATLGGVPLDSTASTQPGMVIATLDPQLKYPTGDKVLLELRSGERTATSLVDVEAMRIDRVRPSPLKLDATQDILIAGAGFAGEKPAVTIDAIALVVLSNSEGEVLARFDQAELAANRYVPRDDARLRVARGAYEANATVSISA